MHGELSEEEKIKIIIDFFNGKKDEEKWKKIYESNLEILENHYTYTHLESLELDYNNGEKGPAPLVAHLHKIENPNAEFPQNIYHYTSLDSLMNIVENKCLWLTDIKSGILNDPTEYIHFDKYIKESQLEYFDTYKEDEKKYSYFISSFTELSDSLSQWRGYGDQGNGVAIEFDSRKLVKTTSVLSTSVYHHVKLDSVIYVDLNNIKSAEGLQKWIEANSEKYDVSSYPQYKYPEKFPSLNGLLNIQPFIKNSGYTEEKEWRLAVLQNNYLDSNEDLENLIHLNRPVKYRSRNGNIAAYIEYPLYSNCISKIILGPKSILSDYDKRVLKQFLKDKLGYEVKVEHSKIEYR